MIVRVVLILLLAGVVAGCGSADGGGGGKTTVAAAFYPLAYAAEEIDMGADVTNMTPPGTEPHDAELSARDVERIRSADVVLYLGSGFQPAFERAVDGADGEAVDLLEGIELREDPEGEADADPHVWLDPLRYAEMARRVGDVLDSSDGAARFADRLERLHDDFERGLANCERREIVTSHLAFGYLADRYGLEQIALSGVSPEAEPTPRDLERLIEQVRSSGATTVFFETLVSPRLAETVAREADASTAVLNPLEGLTEKEISSGDEYFSVMRSNLHALRQALGCR
jgi:zinc transport system substrate-binding protein